MSIITHKISHFRRKKLLNTSVSDFPLLNTHWMRRGAGMFSHSGTPRIGRKKKKKGSGGNIDAVFDDDCNGHLADFAVGAPGHAGAGQAVNGDGREYLDESLAHILCAQF